MVRKRVDDRVRTLIHNAVKLRQRSMFVVVGDRARDQVVNLHYILSKCLVKARPSVLWCYKKDLGFITHRKKRMRKMKRDIRRGIRQVDEENPFELFLACTDIRYCYYRDSFKILGNTYGMVVLQDFPNLTPNLLARTIETTEGGGIVVLILKSLSSLKQLYHMSMDVHTRYRTEAFQDVQCRFNERFILSLADCRHCVVVDDELSILPLSSHIRAIEPLTLSAKLDAKGQSVLSDRDVELAELREALKDTQPVGSLVNCARTLDQAKAILTFVEAIADKTLSVTVFLQAARGRGKSAAMGLAAAAAVVYGYGNIFVTAPSPENLKTLFEMLFVGFEALDFKEHEDYEKVQSTNPEFNNAIVRVNVLREHRQAIQYIQPQDVHLLSQAELLLIDEAAAIPLPAVKKLMGPYLIFMSSTVNGYEGTGRSLSLKLVDELRTKSKAVGASALGRLLREVTLTEPIRYAAGDPVESWLNSLLCLECTSMSPPLSKGLPAPEDCELYSVNRDTLFSYHSASEAFLHRMMALYVSSHYKNSPNDLQLISDSPSQRLFVLLGPTEDSQTELPDVLAVVQVCLEGQISHDSVIRGLSAGNLPSGDLIPWVIGQQFQDRSFGQLAGARVIRIAVHPDLKRMGYGSRCLDLLAAYYQGSMVSMREPKSPQANDEEMDEVPTEGLRSEVVVPKKHTKPLLERLDERPPEKVEWLGVSFGLTLSLFNFWQKAAFRLVYVRQTANQLTGECTCIMLKVTTREERGLMEKQVLDGDGSWLEKFAFDCRRRLLRLFSYAFKAFSVTLALPLVQSTQATSAPSPPSTHDLALFFTQYDLRRLEGYSRNLIDLHMVLDLVPSLALLFFENKLGRVNLSNVQAAILLGIGLQHKTINQLEKEFDLPFRQLQAIFNKIIRKLSGVLRAVEERGAALELQRDAQGVKKSEPSETKEKKKDKKKDKKKKKEKKRKKAAVAEEEEQTELEQRQASLLKELDLQQYAVQGTEKDWEEALQRGLPTKTISVKSARKREEGGEEKAAPMKVKKRKRKRDTPGKSKKHKKSKK